jgi:hypothetical protein
MKCKETEPYTKDNPFEKTVDEIFDENEELKVKNLSHILENSLYLEIMTKCN